MRCAPRFCWEAGCMASPFFCVDLVWKLPASRMCFARVLEVVLVYLEHAQPCSRVAFRSSRTFRSSWTFSFLGVSTPGWAASGWFSIGWFWFLEWWFLLLSVGCCIVSCRFLGVVVSLLPASWRGLWVETLAVGDGWRSCGLWLCFVSGFVGFLSII